jgi:dTDP-4-dehydrorhamnose reductase
MFFGGRAIISFSSPGLNRIRQPVVRRLLITGGSGFVGGHLLASAKGKWEIYTTCQSRPVSMEGVTSLALDLSREKKIESVMHQCRPHAVIHAAAMCQLDQCEQDPKKTFHINATATEILAEQCIRYHSRFIFVSTDMVFDGAKGNYSELDETRPINVYGRSKLTAEKFIRAICADSVIARSALIYGRPVTGSNSFSERVLERISRGKPMPLFTDQFRSPILVNDLASALLELADKEWTGIIHLGGETRVDRYTFGVRLAQLKGFSGTLLKPVSMTSSQTAAPRPRDVSFKISLAKKILKTRLPGYEEGLKKA